MYKHDLRNTCCRLYPVCHEILLRTLISQIRMEATNFKSRREHRKDVNRFNRYIKGEKWDAEVSHYDKNLEIQRYLSD